MSRRGSGRGRGRGRKKAIDSPCTEELFTICERRAKIKKNEFEGFKGTEDDADDAEFLESRLFFSVDHPISLFGIKFASELYQNPKDVENVETQRVGDTYDEEAFIYLMDGSREIANTHIDDEVPYKSMIEARFESPVELKKDKIYQIRLLCNVDGAYPMAVCSKSEVKNGISFHFNVGESQRDGIIRALLYKKLTESVS
jgi:hypothetical protein